MKISSASIILKINTEFTNVYKPQSNFPRSGLLWDTCIDTINNLELMNHIIFCNDVMKIPPVKTFLMANDLITPPLSNEEKKAIGAFWGFVFKFVFHYSQQKNDVPINTKTVKKAACFYEPVQFVEVENE